MTSFFATFFYLENHLRYNCGCYTKRCRIYDFLSVFNALCSRISFRKRMNSKTLRFCTQSYEQYHIILHYASNFYILVTHTHNPSHSIEKRFRTLKQLARVSRARVCGGGSEGVGYEHLSNGIKIESAFFSCNFS